MKSKQVIIDVEVVKNWNWVKCGVKEKYYRMRNWWWGLSGVAFIGCWLVGLATLNLLLQREYLLVGVFLASWASWGLVMFVKKIENNH
jgi:hypothetical protein